MWVSDERGEQTLDALVRAELLLREQRSARNRSERLAIAADLAPYLGPFLVVVAAVVWIRNLVLLATMLLP